MNERIIYPQENGIVAIVIPTGEVPIEQLVSSVVPPGVPYKIVDVSEIPEDRTFRGAWEYQE